MTNKRQLAIYNNNDLYDAIFANHNIEFIRTDLICYSIEKTPPFYSNIVTICKGWEPDRIFENIDIRFYKENWSAWSIKDSFAELDLMNFGFSKLFDARWFYLEPEKFAPTAQTENLNIKVIDNDKDLAVWRTAWSPEETGKIIFSSKLLNNQKIYFVAGYKEKEITCGCLVNESNDLLGISNFFAPDSSIYYWSEIIQFIICSIKRTDIVGYERIWLTNELKLLNVEQVGDLTVWLKKQMNF